MRKHLDFLTAYILFLGVVVAVYHPVKVPVIAVIAAVVFVLYVVDYVSKIEKRFE